ncbi:hypothetical protein Taro_026949 [Colocasia esculenta]|uniref:Gag protein n=1 Tax=Colocasia esculenta TaxID=4460 RepID=A0A843VSV4_COLES|nr:hypothetical protein [Colocasia esculenta]
MAGVLPGAGQPVLFLTASLFVALEPLREARRGTVVRPDYGGYSCITCVPAATLTRRGGLDLSRGHVVVTTCRLYGVSDRSVRLLSSDRVRVGLRSPSGSPDPWAAITKIGSSTVAEGRVVGVVTGDSSTQVSNALDGSCSRREERDEQQAPAPQGPTVLPPPPPVDYGVFMQGLVQAMQTQAHTQAALQTQLEAQAQAPSPVFQELGHGGPSIMERFKKMAPPSFKGESQPLLAESWMREIEKIFRAIRCAEEDKVSFATYMLQV